MSEEHRSRNARKIDHLLAKAIAEIDAGRSAFPIAEELNNFIDNYVVKQETEILGMEAINNINQNNLNTIRKDLLIIRGKLLAIAGGFEAAAVAAQTQEKNLLFPALAIAASQGLELTKEFMSAIEKIKANDIDGLGDVPNAVQGLLDAYNNLKAKVGDIGNQ